MAGQGAVKETGRRLAPQSWGDVAIWAVLGVIFITHPVESSRLVGRVVWGTGSWIGYEAFADCGTPPPYDWMGVKECEAAPADEVPASGSGVAPSVAPSSLVPPGGVPVEGGPGSYQGEAYGLRLPTPDRTWAGLNDLRDGMGADIVRAGSGQ